MANTEENLQEIVRAVVLNLSNLPGPSRLLTRTENENTNPEEELRRSFSIPRGQTPLHVTSNSSSSSTQQGQRRSLSQNFNVHTNYSNVKSRDNNKRKGKQPMHSSSTGRFVVEAKSKKSPKIPEPVFKDVCLLPSPQWVEVPRRKAKAKLVCQGMYIDAWSFDKNCDERQLRCDIYKLFEQHLFYNGEGIQYEFVRSIGAEIMPITLQPGQELTGKVLKHITGNGPIYVRTCIDIQCPVKEEIIDSDEEQPPITSFLEMSSESGMIDEEDNVPVKKRPKNETPSTSTCQNFDNIKNIENQLCGMFPFADRCIIEEAITSSRTTEEAVEKILQSNSSIIGEEENEISLEYSLCEDYDETKDIKTKMEALATQMSGATFKLKVDENDILDDALVYYKSPSFDPKRPLRVYFIGQPALDTGGVKREFFGGVKEKFIDSVDFNMFEGPHNRVLFNYNQRCLAAGIPKFLGIIIAHSLLHGCGGFPFLAPSHYYYIATGDVAKSTAYTSIEDVYDYEKKDLIQKLLSATEQDQLQVLNSDESFLALVQESGKTCIASIENKVIIAEAIVAYHVLVKRIAMLDNFAKGLATLGVIKEIRKDPRQFEEMFVHYQNSIQASTVLDKVKFVTKDKTIQGLVRGFINNVSHQDLESFLKFVTGDITLPDTSITVEVDDTAAIFSSTCLCKLTLPDELKDKDQDNFTSCLLAAVRQEGAAFNAV